MIEQWKSIPGFSRYLVSNAGRVYCTDQDIYMALSRTGDGYLKVSLVSDDGSRRTCSVALLVAEAFVEPPRLTEYHTSVCDHVIILDGDLTNLVYTNLAWRPRWFAYRYRVQLTTPQHPMHYHNLRVVNLKTNVEYDSIIVAGVSLGLLFRDVWRSIYAEEQIFPYWDQFEIVGGPT